MAMTHASEKNMPLSTSYPLHPVLRLIHCIQKERGASCAMAGFRAHSENAKENEDTSSGHHPYDRNVRSARMTTNTAVSSFYKRSLGDLVDDGLDIGNKLKQIRQFVDGTTESNNEDRKNNVKTTGEIWFFHQVLSEYNSFLSSIIQNYVIDALMERKKRIETILRETFFNSDITPNTTALSLLQLLLAFVKLKESLGNERATLSGLMAIGPRAANEGGMSASANQQNTERSNHATTRLPMVINNLVIVVEDQHRILRKLEQQTGFNVQSWSDSNLNEDNQLDENYCSLLRLVGDSIKPSDAMRVLQDLIREDFDVNGFQQAMTMEDFWAGITLYMDRLHSMELTVLEELEQCECIFDEFELTSERNSKSSEDLHALLRQASLSTNEVPAQDAIDLIKRMPIKDLKESLLDFVSHTKCNKPTDGEKLDNNTQKTLAHQNPLPDEEDRRELEDWEISLYDVEFLKRIGRGAAGTTYLGKLHGQQVAVKVASISDMGVEGWRTELSSLKRIHHTNIIRFLGAIYNPSPLTYCLVLEFCDGGDLSEALKTNTPPDFFKSVASDVANGLAYLHKKNFLHRDIKPSNVLLHGDVNSGNFIAKLTDFGLAAIVHNTSSTSRENELTAETGTYRYMAPEVIRHESYQYSADIYSFALLMWVIITREPPFKPMGQIEAAGSVALDHARPPFPAGVPARVKDLIETCWVENPAGRIKVEKIIQDLEVLYNHLSPEEKGWLQKPMGHPVYDIIEEAKEVEDAKRRVNDEKGAKKKVSVLKMKSGLFKRKSG